MCITDKTWNIAISKRALQDYYSLSLLFYTVTCLLSHERIWSPSIDICVLRGHGIGFTLLSQYLHVDDNNMESKLCKILMKLTYQISSDE